MISKEGFYKQNSYLVEKKSPISPELKDFFAESRKCQTLYANCEGSYSRRVMSLKDENKLKHFIYFTMYSDGVNNWSTEKNFSKREHVEKILKKIIATSRQFYLEGEIHFGVVWVYYFSYEDERLRSTPVFKIYKSKSGNEAVFLDVSLTLYTDWRYYLDCVEFPPSLLCVPRDGDYFFSSGGNATNEDKRLNLEYLSSKRQIIKKRDLYALLGAGYVPFFQVAIRPWLIKIKFLIGEKLEEVKRIIEFLWRKLAKNSRSIFKIALFGLLFYLKVITNEKTTGKENSIIAMDSLMLLNNILEGHSYDALLNALTDNVICDSTLLTNLHRDALDLIELVSKPVKNWRKILEKFCSIFEACQNFLFTSSYFSYLPAELKLLLFLLSATTKLCKTILSRNQMTSIIDAEITKNQGWGTTRSLLSPNQSSLPNENQNDSFQPPKCCGDMRKYLPVVDSLLLNLHLSESNSAEEFSKGLFQESVAKLHESLEDAPLPSCSFFLGEKGGYLIFLLQNASLPQLKLLVKQLIREDFSIKPEATFFNIILESGRVVGTLYFPEEYSAVGLFSVEAVTQESRKKPLDSI